MSWWDINESQTRLEHPDIQLGVPDATRAQRLRVALEYLEAAQIAFEGAGPILEEIVSEHTFLQLERTQGAIDELRHSIQSSIDIHGGGL